MTRKRTHAKASVWVVERRDDDRRDWDQWMYYLTRDRAVECAAAERPFRPRTKFRVREYRRVDA